MTSLCQISDASRAQAVPQPGNLCCIPHAACAPFPEASSGQDRSVTLKAGMVAWLFGAHISSNGSRASENLAPSSSLTELTLMAAYAHSSAMIAGLEALLLVRPMCDASPLHIQSSVLCFHATPGYCALVDTKHLCKLQVSLFCHSSDGYSRLSGRENDKACLPGTYPPYGSEAAAPLLSRVYFKASNRIPWQVASTTLHSG